MKNKKLSAEDISAKAINMSPTENNLREITIDIMDYAYRSYVKWKKSGLKINKQ